ncbi:lymphocyte activation gene 3 protein-like isoform X1 [Heterodontus francisci]|uniref:lymphocyte activation gene 3 protein-like isoform X1 n=1 Tax=Heterodontus francisci TaxID=7792 RepID=UPI00355ADC9D
MLLLREWIVTLLAMASATRATDENESLRETVLAPAGSTAILTCSDPTAPRFKGTYRKLALRWALETPGPGRDSRLSAWGSRYTLLMVGSDGVVKRGLVEISRRMRVARERIERGDYSVEVQRVRPGDAGTYHCLVRHGTLRLKKVIRLHVVQVSTDSPGVPLEGGTVSLLCNISEALPRARGSWNRAGAPVRKGERIWTDRDGRRLHIGKVQSEDRGDWECRVVVDGFTVSATYNLKIFGFAGPEGVVPVTYASPGAVARLALRLAPSRPPGPLDVGWLKGQEAEPLLDGGRQLTELRPGALTLTLAPVLPSDRGLYTGYVNVTGHRIERTARLELVQVTASQEGPVPRGSSIRLNFSTSYPAGLDVVVWHHENGSAGQAGESFWEEGGSLYIPRVTPAHSGNWTCTFFRRGQPIGTVTYLLDVSALDYQAAEPQATSSRITLVVVLTLLLLLILCITLIILRKWRSRGQDFPALDVTLVTAALPTKKL